jgi:PTH2 family peptidyl-tRNA hydrolase
MSTNDYRQIIVMRNDLNMRKGKMVAQGAHACLKVTLENLDHPNVKAWLADAFTKITVKVESEQELKDIYELARAAGIPCSIIMDAGKTEFAGVPTLTCCAIGPANKEDLDKITGHLRLL